MALVVNTNVPSIASQRYLMESRKEMETAMERLSSGKRINSAADDAAGLAISTRMDSQIRGLNVAIRNANDGISLTQTAEGAMQEVTDMLQRMRELSLQSVQGSNSDSDREALDAEIQQLKAEIDRVAETTKFNNINILDGSYDVNMQIGYNASETVSLAIADVSTESLGLATSGTPVVDSSNPNTLISTRRDDLALASFDAGDILINNQALNEGFSGAGGDDITDLVRIINDSVDNVTASAYNVLVADRVGTGVIEENQVAIKIGEIGTVGETNYQAEKEVVLDRAANSMEEIVDQINNRAFVDGEVVASLDDEGKLVLFNNSGASISIADASGTDTGYDGGTGFIVSAEATSNIAGAGAVVYTASTEGDGFLKLESNDDNSIRITKGNEGLAFSDIGTTSDIAVLGFRETSITPDGSPYTVTGNTFTDAGLEAALGRSDEDATVGNQADLIINDVEIYDDDLSAASNSFQGKLDLINAFSDETNVVASAYFEKTFDMSNVSYVAGSSFNLNGVEVTYGTDLATTATAINAVTTETGVTAEVTGNNLTLSGKNVQTISIDHNDFELDETWDRLNNFATLFPSGNEAMSAAQTATRTREVTISTDAGYTAGITLRMTIQSGGFQGLTGGGTQSGFFLSDKHGGGATTASISFDYEVEAGDTAFDIAIGFRDLILNRLNADGYMDTTGSHTVGTTAITLGQLMRVVTAGAATSVQFQFATAMALGSAALTFDVVQLGQGERFFSATDAATNYYGALQLQSQTNEPITIQIGESAVLAQHGLLEQNIGNVDFDLNGYLNPSSYSAVSGLSVATSEAASEAINVLDAALETISDYRSDLGALENRLDHTISNLSNVVENTAASQSRILDADFAVEAANLARAQILQQAGSAMLAQANAAPQNVLSLLG